MSAAEAKLDAQEHRCRVRLADRLSRGFTIEETMGTAVTPWYVGMRAFKAPARDCAAFLARRLANRHVRLGTRLMIQDR